MKKNILRKYPLPMKDDPLQFVWQFHQCLFSHKLFSPFVYGSCFVYATAALVSMVHLFLFDGIDFLRQYSVVPSTMPWAIVTAMTEYYWIQPAVELYVTKKYYWDVSSASAQKQIEMRKEIWIVRLTCTAFILQSTINSIVGFFVGFHSDIRSDIHSADILFNGHRYLKIFFYLILNIAHSVVTLISISIYLVLKYFASSTKIQLQLLADFLGTVEIYGKKEDAAIREHLKICCKHHSSLLDHFAMVQDISFYPLIPCSAGGSIAMIGCLICMYYNKNIEDISYMLLLLSLVGMILLDCCQSGQDLEDAFAEFSTNLTKIKWYEWTEHNKKMLLFMLMRSQKNAQIKAINTSFNRTLIIQIVRAAYQILVVLKGRI